MKRIFWLAFILMLSLTVTACNPSGSTSVTTLPSTTAASPSTPAASPSPASASEPETLAAQFIAAQNAHDWDTFVSLWTEEEQTYYKDFFAYQENDENKNGYFSIETASLNSISEIQDAQTFIESYEYYKLLPYGFDRVNAIKKYGEVRVFTVSADYHLAHEFWDYREGSNTRVLVLVPENGVWKVSQDYQETDDEIIDTSEEDLVDGTVHYTKSIDAYFIGVEEGDYFHIGVKTIEGEEMWFWVAFTDPDLESLEALHKYQKLSVTWQNADGYIEEAERVINMDTATDLKLIN